MFYVLINLRGEFENKCECPCIKSTSSISKFLTIFYLCYGSCEYFGRKVNVMALSCGSQCKETKHHQVLPLLHYNILSLISRWRSMLCQQLVRLIEGHEKEVLDRVVPIDKIIFSLFNPGSKQASKQCVTNGTPGQRRQSDRN